MIAWVLIIGMGVSQIYTIPGIVSKQECEALLKKIDVGSTSAWPSGYCYSYRMAK